MTIEQTESKIINWASDRGIFAKASSKDQFVKMVEEVGEIAECLSKNRPVEELELEIGDLLVTAAILAAKNGTTLSVCINKAYEKISGRTGKTVYGVFIRD